MFNGFAHGGVVASHSLTSNPSEDMANDSIENFSPLDDAILAATKRACSNLTTWSGGLCPDRDDLTGIVLLKLCSPAIRPILETIWIDPDPDRLLKFVRTVAKHTLVDEVRRLAAKTRNPEGGLVSLDEPIRNEDGETRTQADLISDEDGTFQAFQFEDLREQLTGEEFAVLHGIVANRETEQELAEERGTSDSAISRTYVRAKDKAAKWIGWLKERTEKQVRANVHPTFTRRACLRPNGIAPETLEHWNGLQVTTFHDESSEWRPPITKQPRVRAKRECWNTACQGLAIGPDNLVLPPARCNEAVRFLPAYTGQNNRLCAGCDEATTKVPQIGDTGVNAEAIPLRASSLAMQDSPKELFISSPALSGSAERNENMQARLKYKEAAEIIKTYCLPRSTVARLAGLHLPDLSAWLGGKVDISEEKRERVSLWIRDMAQMVEVMEWGLKIKVDLNDIENVRYLVQKCNDAQMQASLFDSTPQAAD